MLRFADHPIGTLFKGKTTGLIYRLVKSMSNQWFLLLESEHKIYCINTIEDVSWAYSLYRGIVEQKNLNKSCINAIGEL